MDIKELEQIIAILKENGVTEFELNEDGTHLKLSRAQLVAAVPAANPAAPQVTPAVAPVQAGTVTAAEVPASGAIDENLVKVESPIVGTFYRKPSPDADAFVKEGSTVSKGETLCIIEAMKLMNEIEAPCDGKIEKILLSDGQVVEFGEVLFLIDPA